MAQVSIAKEDVGNIVDEFGYTVRGVGVSNGFAYAVFQDKEI